MIKEIIICILIIGFVFTINIITQECTKDAVDSLNEKLIEIKEDILNEKQINDSMKEVLQIWKDKKNILEYYIEHEELEKIEIEIKELNIKIQTKNLEEGLVNIERGVFLLNHVNEKYRLKIQNIF